MTAKIRDFGKEPPEGREFQRMILVSLGVHLLILAFFIQVYSGKGNPIKIQPSYTVDLVSLPGGGSAAGPASEKKAPGGPPPSPAAAKPIPIPKTVPEKPLPAKEDPGKALSQAMEKLKRKVQQEKSLENKLARMEERVNREQTLERTLSQLEQRRQTASAEGGGGSGDVASAGMGPGGTGVRFQIYYAEVLSRIKRNWLLPESLLKRKDLTAVVMIRVNRSGRIEEVKFEKKSGVEHFDQEVLRTLKKSDPLPPLPDGFPRTSHEIFLTFYSRELS